MKRALLVTSGTVAGLVSVLSYSPPAPAALAATAAGAASGLGGPAAAVAKAKAHVPAARRPVKRAAAKAPRTAAPAASRAAAAPSTAPATGPKPVPTTAPAPKRTTKPSPTSAPVVSTPKDYLGAPVTYKYGTIQVGIRVSAGKIVDAWAVKYPVGPSLPYSEMAIPILRSQTVSAQSAHIAGATGASLTSASWISSLTSALSKAGI